MSLPNITPAEAKRLVDKGAILIDIRRADEHAREHIPGARNQPIDSLSVIDDISRPVIFHCMSGLRTQIYAAKLAAAASGESFIVEGGLEAWKKAQGPLAR
jgi:rhodanese-related sulfurtransferase